MADSTIVIQHFGPQFNEQHIRSSFKDLIITKIRIYRETSQAFVQFSTAKDVEALAVIYPDCVVGALGNAPIGFVDAGFVWPKEERVEVNDVNKEGLVLIRDCERIHELSDKEILEIFKKYGINNIARFEESNEVVIEFQEKDDLEALELQFADYKVPKLGNHAAIDIESEVDAEKFVKRLRVMKAKQIQEKKKEEEKSKSEKLIQQKKVEEEKIRVEDKIREKQELEEKEKIVRDQNRKIQDAQKEIRKKAEKQEKEKQEIIDRTLKLKAEMQAEQKRQQQNKQKLLKQSKSIVKEQKQKQQKKVIQLDMIKRNEELNNLQSQMGQMINRVNSREMEVNQLVQKANAVSSVKQQIQGFIGKPKEINLINIAKIQNQQKEASLDPEIKSEVLQTSDLKSVPLIQKEYSSKQPTSYILMVLLAWVYYMLIR